MGEDLKREMLRDKVETDAEGGEVSQLDQRTRVEETRVLDVEVADRALEHVQNGGYLAVLTDLTRTPQELDRVDVVFGLALRQVIGDLHR